MLLWITSVERDVDGRWLFIGGVSFGGAFGFCDGSGETLKRDYAGTMLLLAPRCGTRLEFHGEVGIRVVERGPWDWTLSSTTIPFDKIPSAPFLLTDRIEFSLHYMGKIQIRLQGIGQLMAPETFEDPITVIESTTADIGIFEAVGPDDPCINGDLFLFGAAGKARSDIRGAELKFEELDQDNCNLGIVEKELIS